MKTLTSFLLASMLFISNLFTQYFWTEQVSGVSTSLTSVSNIDAFNAWACGPNGLVIRSTNSGYNWSNLSGNGLPSNISLVHIFGINSTAALAAGYIGSTTYVYRTSNSGANWSVVFTQPNGFVNGIWMQNSASGFIQGNPVGGRWSLWKTTSGGVNWDSTGLFLSQVNGELGFSNSIWGFNSEIWFGTNKSRIYHSTNGSPPWQSQTTAPNTNIYSIWINQSTGALGYAGGDSLSKTTNGGSLWTTNTSISSGTINGLASILSLSNYWYIRSNSNLYFSNSGGPWSVQYTAPSGTYNHISGVRTNFIGGPGAIYAVRDNGGISRLNFFVEGVTFISSEIPSDYHLFQNYPNPFNSTTIFRFDTPKLSKSSGDEVRGGYVRIITYDAAGREEGSLVNEVLQPGSYKVDWEGNDLASGIYFYRLLVSDPSTGSILYSMSRKMVMIK